MRRENSSHVYFTGKEYWGYGKVEATTGEIGLMGNDTVGKIFYGW